MADLASTTDPAVDPRAGAGSQRYVRRRRISSDAFLVVMAAVFLIGLLNVAGVESETRSERANDTTLDVRHGSVSRGGLATPFDITVTRPGGFDGPVTVGVTRDYLSIFDENGLDPQPSSETTMGDWLLWQFEPPEGDTLSVSFDARIEPARQHGASGRVAVLDEENQPVVEVEIRTRVWP